MPCTLQVHLWWGKGSGIMRARGSSPVMGLGLALSQPGQDSGAGPQPEGGRTGAATPGCCWASSASSSRACACLGASRAHPRAGTSWDEHQAGSAALPQQALPSRVLSEGAEMCFLIALKVGCGLPFQIYTALIKQILSNYQCGCSQGSCLSSSALLHTQLLGKAELPA